MILFLKNEEYDVVHCFGSYASIYGRMAGRIAGVPAIFGGFRQQFSHKGLATFLNRILSWGTCGWIVNCQGGKQRVISDYKVKTDKVFVVPNGIYMDEIQSTLSPQEAKALFGIEAYENVISIIGNLRPEKNHQHFLLMVKELLQQTSTPTVFLIAGDGVMRQELEKLAVQYGIAGHLRFLGRCDQIPELLNATDVVALTSLSEGLPNVLVEAGAAGVPSVSTDNGGASEVIVEGETGHITPLKDPSMMAKKILEILNDEGLKLKMGKKAKKIVSDKFSAPVMARNLISVYRNCLGDR